MYNISSRFREAIKDSHTISTKMELYNSNGELLKDDFNIVSGNVSVDATSSTRRRANITISDPDSTLVPIAGEIPELLHPLSNNYIKLYRGVNFGDIVTPEERTTLLSAPGDTLSDNTLYWSGLGADGWVEGAIGSWLVPDPLEPEDSYSDSSSVTTIEVTQSPTIVQENVSSKEDDHLYLMVANSEGTSQVTWVSDNSVDLTNISSINVECEFTIDRGRFYIIASSSKTGDVTVYDEQFREDQGFSRSVKTLDISSLSGSYYIRIHVADDNADSIARAEARVYSVALDGSPSFLLGLESTTYIYYNRTPDIELVPLATLDIFDTVIDDTRDELKIQLRLFDFSRKIERARLLENYRIAPGTNYRDAIHDIINDGVPDLQYDLPSVDFVTPNLIFGSSGDQGGGDRWKYAREMAQSIGYELYFNRNGVVTLRPVIDVDTQPIVWRYDETDNANLLFVTREISKEETYNVVQARGESTSNTEPVTATAMDENPLSSTYVGDPPGSSAYGMVPTFLNSKYITTESQAQQAAEARLKQVLGSTEKMRIMTIVNPAFEGNDLIRVIRGRSNLDCRFLIDRFNIPLDYNVSMNFTMREMRRRAIE